MEGMTFRHTTKKNHYMTNLVQRIATVTFGILLLLGCQRKEKAYEAPAEPLEAPPSYLNFRINFPIHELEAGINEVMPARLMNGPVELKNGDTLYMDIQKRGKLLMKMSDNKIVASVPLRISAAIQKKVMGITFSNRDTPLEVAGVVQAEMNVDVDDQWNLNFTCQYKNFNISGSPVMNILGVRINVEKTLQNALEDHSDQLSDVICGALKQTIDFRQILSNIWEDIQKPQRIANKPRMYLHSRPIALNGTLLTGLEDTLSLQLEYRTRLSINPVASPPGKTVPLTSKGEPMDDASALVAYPMMEMSYATITSLMEAQLQDREFTYEGYKVKIKSAKASREGQRLKIALDVDGDMRGTVIVTGKPTIDADRQLIVEDFSYEIDGKDKWLKLTDWAVHQFVEEYLASQLRMDANPFFIGLDKMITDAVSKAPISQKMELWLKFKKIDSYQTRLTEEGLQWVFYVEGASTINLRRGLFQ